MKKSHVWQIQTFTSSQDLKLQFKLLNHFESSFIVYRYLNINIGSPDIEESFGISKPINPQEVY